MTTNKRASLPRSTSQSNSSATMRWLAGLFVLAVMIVATVWWRGARQYPEVTSSHSLGLMRALYTACSSQNSTRLAVVEREVENAHSAGQLTEAEREAFQSIIALTKQNQWTQATEEAYRFAQNQVR